MGRHYFSRPAQLPDGPQPGDGLPPRDDADIEGSHAAHEARAVVGLVRRHVLTLDAARDLIGVPPRLRAALEDFAERGGFSARHLVTTSLRFRADVAREFELLVRDDNIEDLQSVH